MPEHLSNALKKTAFMMISFLLLPTFSAHAGEDFEAGLEEGRRHGAEILSRHSGALRPSDIPQDSVPGYGAQTQQGLRSEGSRWTEDPEGMRIEAEGSIQGGDPSTSDAPGFLKRSSAQRPVIHYRPRNGPHDPELQGGDREPYPSMRKRRGVHRVRRQFLERAGGVL